MTTPSLFTLIVRGNSQPKTADARRTLHNETAGSVPGMNAARAATDLSHQVFVPCSDAGKMGGTSPDELLFVDVWADPSKMNAFFANPAVQEQAGKLFGQRDGSLWVPAQNAYALSLMIPSHASKLYLGMIRTAVPSIDTATKVMNENGMKHMADARRRGLVSHQTFFRFNGPGAPAPELLGLDLWCDLKGMMEHYAASMSQETSAFSGQPETSIWERAQGYNEW